MRGDVVPTHNGHIPTDMPSAAGCQRRVRGLASRFSSGSKQPFCRDIWRVLPGSLQILSSSLLAKPHNLTAPASPISCRCRRAFTRDSLAARLPCWSATVLHGLCPGLHALHAVPVQEVTGFMSSYINLLSGSKPRTLPIRPSMATTMLILVIAVKYATSQCNHSRLGVHASGQ